MLIGIYAQLSDGTIAVDGKLPWIGNKEFKSIFNFDMNFFKETTKGHHVVMGRNTWQSLGCKRLPGRKIHYIITTKTPPPKLHENVQYITLNKFKWLCRSNPSEKYMLIGGAQLYKELIPFCDTVYQSVIDIPDFEYPARAKILKMDKATRMLLEDETKYNCKALKAWVTNPKDRILSCYIKRFIRKEH